MLINYKNNKIFVFSDSHGLHKHIDIPQDTDITICLGDAVEDNLDLLFSFIVLHIYNF